jgi:hypothetical protein
VVIDHIGLLKTTKIPTKLLTRCQMNLDMLEILWFYTSVSQFNRSIANPMRIKAGDVEPQRRF